MYASKEIPQEQSTPYSWGGGGGGKRSPPPPEKSTYFFLHLGGLFPYWESFSPCGDLLVMCYIDM